MSQLVQMALAGLTLAAGVGLLVYARLTRRRLAAQPVRIDHRD